MSASMLKIKPLSVNEAWQGRRFSTKKKKAYEQHLCLLLPANVEKHDKYTVFVEFGFSNKAADIDNPLKPFFDCLHKKYGIDDKYIYEINVRKSIVKKGEEYIYFDLREFNDL
jgi:Holliday junction resolvase RusA-like endonuclease